jgi:1-deoxy-D-xylulose-5-phosphate synthase
VNARLVKPLDEALLMRLASASPLIVCMEENSLACGFGAQVAGFLADHAASGPRPTLLRLGVPDRFVAHGARENLLHQVGLAPEIVAARVLEEWAKRAGPAARPRAAGPSRSETSSVRGV